MHRRCCKLQQTNAELRAENVRLHAKNQELERELELVKEDFHKRGLVNLREIIQDHRQTEEKLEAIIHDNNRFADSLHRNNKYAKRVIQHLRTEADLFRAQRNRLLGAADAREDLLVEPHELRELTKSIPSSTRVSFRPLTKCIPSSTRIGSFMDAAYHHMEADNDDSAELTEQDEDA